MNIDQYFNRRILGATLVGIGNFLRAASDRDPNVRRQRYFRLLVPIAPEVVARFSLRPETDEGQPPGGRFSLIPFGIAFLGLAIFMLFIRPRVGSGRRPRQALGLRRLSVAFEAAGILLRRRTFPFLESRTAWLAAAGPILGEIVDETVSKRHPKLARILSAGTGITVSLGTWWIDRPKQRGDHAS